MRCIPPVPFPSPPTCEVQSGGLNTAIVVCPPLRCSLASVWGAFGCIGASTGAKIHPPPPNFWDVSCIFAKGHLELAAGVGCTELSQCSLGGDAQNEPWKGSAWKCPQRSPPGAMQQSLQRHAAAWLQEHMHPHTPGQAPGALQVSLHRVGCLNPVTGGLLSSMHLLEVMYRAALCVCVSPLRPEVLFGLMQAPQQRVGCIKPARRSPSCTCGGTMHGLLQSVASAHLQQGSSTGACFGAPPLVQRVGCISPGPGGVPSLVHLCKGWH